MFGIRQSDKNKGFLTECVNKNYVPATLMLHLLLAIQCILLAFYAFKPDVLESIGTFSAFGTFAICSTILNVLLAILLCVFRHSANKLGFIEHTILLALDIGSAVYSALAIRAGLTSYLYTVILVAVAFAFHMHPARVFLCGLSSYVLYLALLLGGSSAIPMHITYELYAPAVMLAVTGVVALARFRGEHQNYLKRQHMREKNQLLQYFANYDYLTRISNRKMILEHLDNLLTFGDESITCMMADVDCFKLFNDTYGHICGDDCLVRLAKAMQEVVHSKGGKIGRYGGEEFLAVFSGLDEKSAMITAKELCSAVREANVRFKAIDYSDVVTVSVGTFVYHRVEKADGHTLIHYADKALYRAKKEGRNRVCAYIGEMSVSEPEPESKRQSV